MKIEAVRYAGGNLILKTSDAEAKHFVYNFKPGDYDIQKHRNKRSNDANGLCWTMIHRIAEAVNLPEIEVYRNAIKEVGVYRDFEWSEDEAKTLRTAWSKLGLGWVTEQLDYDAGGKNVVVRCYYGSSTYNTKQMSRLIDSLLQEAENLDIPTPESERIDSLLRDWDAKKQKG